MYNPNVVKYRIQIRFNTTEEITIIFFSENYDSYFYFYSSTVVDAHRLPRGS